MNRTALRLILLLTVPALGMGQVKLGQFTFLKDSKATTFTANLALGGIGIAGLSAEVPTLKALSFLDFIPGYANRFIAITNGKYVYMEVAMIARARYRPKRKIIGLIGLGPGLGISADSFDPKVSVIIGANILISDKYALTIDVRSAGFWTIGLGWHNGYGWR